MSRAFEVGKNYKRSITGETGECVYSGNAKALFIIGYRHVLVDQYNKDWEEVKEPRKISGWVRVHERYGQLKFGVNVFTSEFEARRDRDIFDAVFVEYVEKV
jgi:hypothetical protein